MFSEQPNLGVVPPNAATVVSNNAISADISAGGGLLTTQGNIGPFYQGSQIGVVQGNFETERVSGFAYGGLAAQQYQASSIGAAGLSQTTSQTLDVGKFKDTFTTTTTVGKGGVDYKAKWQICGDDINVNCSTACCCGPVAQFFSAGLSKVASLGKDLANTVWGCLKEVPWKQTAIMAVKGIAYLVLGILKVGGALLGH